METKQEFLDGLRRALTGKMSQQEVEEHIRYYDDYITAEMRIGRSEGEVLGLLGNPRLIAMSICDANAAGEKAEGIFGDADSHDESYGADSRQSGEGEQAKRPFVLRHPKLTIALIIIAILAVLGLGIWLTVSVVSFFWPVIVAVVVIALVIRLVSFIRQNW